MRALSSMLHPRVQVTVTEVAWGSSPVASVTTKVQAGVPCPRTSAAVAWYSSHAPSDEGMPGPSQLRSPSGVVHVTSCGSA